MSEPAVVENPAPKPTPVLGSFAVGPRVIDATRRLGTTILVAVNGRSGTPLVDHSGFAACAQVDPTDAAALVAVRERLERIAAFQHSSVAPILEQGVVGKIAYVAEAAVPGVRLADRLTSEGPMPAWRMAAILATLAGALQAAHEAGIAHGAVTPLTIWIDDAGAPTLGAFNPAAGDFAHDQRQLAALAFELFAGRPWASVPGADVSGGALVDRVRGNVNGMSERVAIVIARGLERESALQYASVGAFGAALAESVALSAQEIAAGAWEAISRQDQGMAAILNRMLVGYDPASPEIALLTHRLSGSRQSTNASTTLADPAQLLRTLADRVDQREASIVTATGAALSEAELRELFGAVPNDQPLKRGNPWVIVLAVVFGMIVIFTILAALMFGQS